MKKIIERKVLIKDYINYVLVGLILVSGCFAHFFNLQGKQSDILAFEQTIFLILSAILFVFHESLIGHSTITKIINDIKNISKNEIREKIFSSPKMKHMENYYDDFLNSTTEDIISFKQKIMDFKRKSFLLYGCFAFAGLVIVATTMIIDEVLVNKDTNIYSLNIGFLLEVMVFFQVFSVIVWIVSAYQSEQQKNQMLKFATYKNICAKLNQYVENSLDKSIDFGINNMDVELVIKDTNN